MMKRNYLLLLPLLMMSSCRVLTDVQRQNVKSFAETAREYTAYPSLVAQRRAALHVDDQLLRISRFSNGDLIVKSVEGIRDNLLHVQQINRQFDVSIDIIKTYADLLLTLTSDEPQNAVTESAATLGEKFSGLIAAWQNASATTLPDDAGDRLSGVIAALGKQYVRHRQAKALAKFIPAANRIIQPLCQSITQIMGASYTDRNGRPQPGLQSLIEHDSASLVQDFNANIVAASRVDYFTIKLLYDRLTDVQTISSLRTQSVAATQQLALAHQALTDQTRSRMRLSGLIAEIKDLVSVVQQCRDAIQQHDQ